MVEEVRCWDQEQRRGEGEERRRGERAGLRQSRTKNRIVAEPDVIWGKSRNPSAGEEEGEEDGRGRERRLG